MLDQPNDSNVSKVTILVNGPVFLFIFVALLCAVSGMGTYIYFSPTMTAVEPWMEQESKHYAEIIDRINGLEELLKKNSTPAPAPVPRPFHPGNPIGNPLGATNNE